MESWWIWSFSMVGTFPWIMSASTKAFRTPLTLCTCAVSWFLQGIHDDSEDNEAPKELNACRKAELAFVVPAGAGWQVSLKFDTLPTIPYLVLPHMGTLHCILMWVYLYMCVYIYRHNWHIHTHNIYIWICNDMYMYMYVHMYTQTL